MTDIMHIINKYKSMDNAVVITHPDFVHDLTLLDTLKRQSNEEDKEIIDQFLKDLLHSIENEIENVESMMQAHPDKMEMIRKNAEACQAYIKAK